MSLLNFFAKSVLRSGIKQFEHTRDNPLLCQESVFQYLISNASQTVWGKQYEYSSFLKNEGIQKFQETVPLQTYDEIKPWVERIMRGEQNVLWNSRIEWFAKSSGTTSDKSKFIPLSGEAIKDCHFKGSKHVLASYIMQNPDTKLFTGKSLVLGGSHKINQLSTQSKIGDLSAVLLSNMPFWAQWRRTPTLDIALMDEWEKKLEMMAKQTVKEKVTSLAGVPSWTLVLIKKILEMTGKTNLLDIWKDLELFIHGGVSFKPYKDQFTKIVQKSDFRYMETYNASEGFFSLQDDPKSDDMLLITDCGMFFEFIPMDSFHSQKPKCLTLDQVEVNKNYAIVISTNTGLWRYVIGDTVRFSSVKPYKLKISGRTKLFINVFGEEVIVDNALAALSVACMRTTAVVHEFTAAPVYMGDNNKGRHQWLVEFEKMPDNLNAFVLELDLALQSVNSDYEAKRYKNLNLDSLEVIPVRAGTFHTWLKQRGKLGGQHKVPCLANDRQYVEEILKIHNDNSIIS